MTWQVSAFGIVFLVATLINGSIMVYSLRHRDVRGAFAFGLMMATMTVWALFLALEYSVVEIEHKILFSKFQYLGISTIGLTWFLFAYSYSRGHILPGRNYLFLVIFPIVLLGFTFTNEAHGLLWPDIRPVSAAPGADLIYEHGPVFWASLVYNYILLAIGAFIIIRTALGAKDIYRWQMVGLVASALIPWIGNFISVAGLSPVPGLDLAPIAFVLSGIIIAWSIFFLRLLDLLPVAYDQVIANLTDGVIVLDVHHRVADANPQARKILGDKVDRIVGRNILEVLQPWPDLVEKISDFDTGQMEISVNDERIGDLDMRISALLDNRGNRAGRVVIFRDISQPKKLERMRQDLTQSIVNDLRNPLTSMSLNLEMLRRQTTTLLPKQQLDVIDLSQASVQQMLELTSSILDIYQLQSGELSLEKKSTFVQLLAEDSIKPLAALANKKRLLLQVDIPEGMQPALIDPNLIRRVIQNLLGNAIKLSKEGRVIRLMARYDKTGSIVISVIDSGEGLETVLTSDSFEKPISSQMNSGGLGLVFCRLAVEAHGGKIWVDDSYENGTKISFSLP